MLYRSKIERVLCPVSCIATRSGTPRRTMFRTAVRRRSWGMRPGQPAAAQAAFHAFVRLTMRCAFFGPPRPAATSRTNTHGRISPAFFRRLRRVLLIQEPPQAPAPNPDKSQVVLLRQSAMLAHVGRMLRRRCRPSLLDHAATRSGTRAEARSRYQATRRSRASAGPFPVDGTGIKRPSTIRTRASASPLRCSFNRYGRPR